MKKRRRVLIVAGLLAGVVTLGSIFVRSRATGEPTIASSRFIFAMSAYARDRKAQGKPVPDIVSLRELVDGGYVTRAQTGIFSNLDLSISTRTDDTNPQMLLAWARLSDGTYSVALADGSVQQLPPAAVTAALATQRLTNGGVNQQ